MIPPDHDGEYVACMEDVLTVYERPYDPTVPVVCMDEQPVQLIKETRQPIPAAAGRPARVDYEYERNGTAAIFMFTEPKAGWRDVSVRERRTKLDWLTRCGDSWRVDKSACRKVTLVMDNLNTHTTGSLIPPCGSPTPGAAPGNPLHPQTWQLAQHCRERTQHLDAPMPGSTDRHDPGDAGARQRVAEEAQQTGDPSPLALYAGSRPRADAQGLPTDGRLTDH